jgi:hypothetical protein
MPQDDKQIIRDLKEKIHNQEIAIKKLEIIVGTTFILAGHMVTDISSASPIAINAAEEIAHTILRLVEGYR